MFNLEFNLQELHELHTMLVLRKCELNAQLTHKNKDVASIAMRQLERVSPMLYYVKCIVKEHHAEAGCSVYRSLFAQNQGQL